MSAKVSRCLSKKKDFSWRDVDVENDDDVHGYHVIMIIGSVAPQAACRRRSAVAGGRRNSFLVLVLEPVMMMTTTFDDDV